MKFNQFVFSSLLLPCLAVSAMPTAARADNIDSPTKKQISSALEVASKFVSVKDSPIPDYYLASSTDLTTFQNVMVPVANYDDANGICETKLKLVSMPVTANIGAHAFAVGGAL